MHAWYCEMKPGEEGGCTSLELYLMWCVTITTVSMLL